MKSRIQHQHDDISMKGIAMDRLGRNVYTQLKLLSDCLIISHYAIHIGIQNKWIVSVGTPRVIS